jgi:hypothetical protein
VDSAGRCRLRRLHVERLWHSGGDALAEGIGCVLHTLGLILCALILCALILAMVLVRLMLWFFFLRSR